MTDSMNRGASQFHLDRLRVSIAVAESSLVVTINNPTDRRILIWSRACSWGWSNLSLEIAGDDGDFVFSPAPKRFTRNFPRWIDLSPRADEVVTLSPGDPIWEGDGSLEDLLQKPFELRVTLSIEATEEAGLYGIALGTTSSEPILVAPPHRWLQPAGDAAW